MMPFDPDKYLQEKAADTTTFDPDKYLADKTPMGMGEYIGRGVTKAIPAVLGVGGAALGTALGPAGMIGGGGLGYAGGKEIEGLINEHAFGDKPMSTNPIDQAERIAGNSATGAIAAMAGPIANKVASSVAAPVKQAISSGIDNVTENAPEMVGSFVKNAGRTAGYMTHLPGGETAGGMLGEKLAPAAEAGTRSLINRLTGSAAEEGAEASVPSAVSQIQKLTSVATADSQIGIPEVFKRIDGSRFVAPLQQALQKGDDAYRTTFFILSQQFPQFRKLLGN